MKSKRKITKGGDVREVYDPIADAPVPTMEYLNEDPDNIVIFLDILTADGYGSPRSRIIDIDNNHYYAEIINRNPLNISDILYVGIQYAGNTKIIRIRDLDKLRNPNNRVFILINSGNRTNPLVSRAYLNGELNAGVSGAHGQNPGEIIYDVSEGTIADYQNTIQDEFPQKRINTEFYLNTDNKTVYEAGENTDGKWILYVLGTDQRVGVFEPNAAGPDLLNMIDHTNNIQDSIDGKWVSDNTSGGKGKQNKSRRSKKHRKLTRRR